MSCDDILSGNAVLGKSISWGLLASASRGQCNPWLPPGLAFGALACSNADVGTGKSTGSEPDGPEVWYSCSEIVRTAPDRLEARVSVGEHVISASLVLLGVGIVFPGVFGLKLLLTSRNTFDAIIPMVFLGIIGVFLVGLGVMSWGWQRMEFDGRDRVLRLRRTEKGLGRHIPFDDIESVRILPVHRARVAGKIHLSLSRPADRPGSHNDRTVLRVGPRNEGRRDGHIACDKRADSHRRGKGTPWQALSPQACGPNGGCY